MNIDKTKRALLIERALANPQIADFSLSRAEIERNLTSIYKIFKTDDRCKNSSVQNLCGSDGFHFKLTRDKSGKIDIITYPCPKNIENKSFLIKNNYVYSSVILTTKQQLLNRDFIKTGDLVKDPHRINLVNFLLRVNRGKIAPKGIYIYGDAGVGKTYLTIALCNELAIKNKKIAYLNLNNFSLDVMLFVKQQKDISEIIEILKTVDVLVLDELGSEKYNSYVHSQILYAILNFRLNTNKLTIFCSKYSLNELLRVYKASNPDKNIKGFIERINNIYEINVFHLPNKFQ